jgi:uncharacterized coiled-coil protein SlyX
MNSIDTNSLIIVMNSFFLILLSIIGYFVKQSFERLELKLQRQEESLKDMSNSLAKIQVWEDFVTNQLKDLKDKIKQYDDNMRVFHEYREALDFIKRNYNPLIQLVNKVQS